MPVEREMPKYQCHKRVHALKIEAIQPEPAPGAEEFGERWIKPADEGFDVFIVSLEYVRKHQPQVGGYYVVYEDGYQSYSPAAAFESGYTRI